MTKGVDEKIDEDVLRWFGHVERIENDRIAKKVYVWSMLIAVHWVRRGRGGLIP